MADLDALRRLFHLNPSQILFKFGPKAYNIDLSQSTQESVDLNEWSTSLLSKNNIKTMQRLKSI